jgi:hypothetical protein
VEERNAILEELHVKVGDRRRSCGEHFRDLHDESANSINATIKSNRTLYTNYTDKQPQHQTCLLHATAVFWISP